MQMAMQIKQIDLNGVNCYLGCEDGKYVLFDTGGHLILDKAFDDRRAALLEALEKNGCNKENLKLLVLTHGDCDHVASAAYLRDKFGLKIAMHKDDLNLVQAPKIDDVMASFRYRSLLYKIVMGLMKKKIRLVMQKTIDTLDTFAPDIFLEEGDSLKPYGFNATVLHLPGHTPGSIGILTADNEIVAGDIYYHDKKLDPAVNAMDFAGVYKSIERIKALQVKSIYCGHGKPWFSK